MTESIATVRKDRDEAVAILNKLKQQGAWYTPNYRVGVQKCFYCHTTYPEHTSKCVWAEVEDWLFYYNSP